MKSHPVRRDQHPVPVSGTSREEDRRAVDELFTRYYTSLVRFACGYVHSSAIAEELAQEAFVKLWEHRASLSHSDSIRAWLYTTVRRLALNHLKHLKVREAYDDEWMRTNVSVSVQPEHAFGGSQTDDDLKEALRQAILELPEKNRTTFTLHRYEGLTYEEIAHVLDVPVKTVESRMTRTLKNLRSQLAALLSVALVALLVG